VTTTAADKPTRAELLRAARDARIDAAFSGRVFDIIREVHLPEGQVFETILGTKVRHGYVIKDRENGELFAVGWTLLKHIHDRYLGVNLPKGKRIHPGNPMRTLN